MPSKNYVVHVDVAVVVVIVVVAVVVVILLFLFSKHPYTKVSREQATHEAEHAMNKYFGPSCSYPTPPTMFATK